MADRKSNRNEEGEEDQTNDKNPCPNNYRMHSSPTLLLTANTAALAALFATTITHSVTPCRLFLLRFHNQSLDKNTQATRLLPSDYCTAS